MEKLTATLENVRQTLLNARIPHYLEAELSLESLPVVSADLTALEQIRDYFKRL